MRSLLPARFALVLLVIVTAAGLDGASARQATPATEIATAPIFLVYGALLNGDTAFLDEGFAPDFVDHTPAPGSAPGVEGVRQRIAGTRAAFPDLQVSIDDIFVEGNLVVVRLTMSGTQDGPFLGVAPTGDPVTYTAVDVWRLRPDETSEIEAKITESWHVQDDLDILRQIGAWPGGPIGASPLATPSSGPNFDATTDAATIDANKTIARRWNEEIWGQSSQAALDDIVSPDLVFHEAGVSPDLAGLEESVAAVAAAFPDRRFDTVLVVAAGDRAAVVWSGTGTQQGETFGVPPTGKSVTLDGIDILRIDNGKVVEAWSTSDNLGTLIQLGAYPAPGTPVSGTPAP